MSDNQIWSNDVVGFKIELESKGIAMLRHEREGFESIVQLFENIILYRPINSHGKWHPFKLEWISTNILWSQFKEAQDNTKELEKLREDLCKKYDALVSAMNDNDTRRMRNAMDELHDTIQAVGTFEGSANLKPLPANFTTLDRYIP